MTETRGRPAVGKSRERLLVTLPTDLLRRLDRWRESQFDADMNRQAAIRQLLELALSRKEKGR
jgi:metal-responsive CopG/Arc/MetJ family transcriptional regulator